MQDEPHLMYNIYYKGLSIDHKPLSVVSDSTYSAHVVTSDRGKVLAFSEAEVSVGLPYHQFFLNYFPGKRMRPELLSSASPVTNGTE